RSYSAMTAETHELAALSVVVAKLVGTVAQGPYRDSTRFEPVVRDFEAAECQEATQVAVEHRRERREAGHVDEDDTSAWVYRISNDVYLCWCDPNAIGRGVWQVEDPPVEKFWHESDNVTRCGQQGIWSM